MFLGIQKDIIVFVAETREALEKIPLVSFDRIEETDKEYVLVDGVYTCEPIKETLEVQEEKDLI